MTVGSLFTGIGGLDLGFERAGFEIRWMCEQNTFCQRVLRKHWPTVPIYDDVRTLSTERIEPVDCIIGGFPCQDISVAGSGAGLDGEQSRLWWSMYGAISAFRPRYAVMENVPALTGRGLHTVLGSLSEIGYDAEWTIVSAASVGAPHIRERIFIVAYSQHGGLPLRRRTENAGEQNGGLRHIPRDVASRGTEQAGTLVAYPGRSGCEERDPSPIAEVARVVGRCNDTVLAWIGDGARDKRTALRLHFDNADRIRRIERACRLRADGMALKEIATLFGVSESGVRNWWKSEHNPYRVQEEERRSV